MALQQQQEKEDEEINICLRIIETVSLKISKFETVGGLKSLLFKKKKIPECIQEFFFDGNHLKNEKTLVDYGICSNANLNAYVGNSELLRLTITIPSLEYRTFNVEVRTRDTIQNVKALIEAKENILSGDYRLVYDGKFLEEDKTLAFLNIGEGSRLCVVFNPRDVLQVSVNVDGWKIVNVEVGMLHTILDLKTLVDYPLTILKYGGMQLEDSKTLSFYNIRDGSILVGESVILEGVNRVFRVFRLMENRRKEEQRGREEGAEGLLLEKV